MKIRLLLRRVLCLLLALSLVACGDRTAGQTFRLDIFSEPSSLDPQTVSSNDQHLILLNTMEGLTRLDAEQIPVAAAAKSWTVSEDGLSYTFTLHDDMVWSDGKTPVTAYDFQFAFRRLLDPQTQAPSAVDFLCIRGASAVFSGQTLPRNLGVRAEDETTLTIHLEYQNPAFLSLLATPAALPCNESFFLSTRGKYGVSHDFLLFNGPFTIYRWEQGQYIHMRKNGDYHREDSVIPDAFRLYIQNQNDLTRLTDGSTDAAQVAFADLAQLTEQGYGAESFVNILWAVLPNLDRPVLANQSIRQALAAVVSREELAGSLSDNLQMAQYPVPPAIHLGNEGYREQAGNIDPLSRLDYAPAELYQIGLRELELEEHPSLTLICPDSNGIPLLLSQLQRQWLDTLGIFVNIEPLEQSRLEARIRQKDYDLALCSIYAAYDSPEAILTQLFGKGSLTGWQDEQLDRYLSQTKLAGTQAGVLSAYRSAELLLCQAGVVIPLLYETTYYVSAPTVTGLVFSPFGCHVRFAQGRKE